MQHERLDTFPTCHWIFVEKQIRRDKHDVRFQFVRTSSSSPRNNSVFTVIDAPAQPTASILSRDVSFQSILVPLTPSRLIIALYSRPKSKLLHLKNLYSPPGINDFVEIVEWICPMREIYREFYHFIAWQIKSFDETASKILFPSLFFLVAILNSGGKWLNRGWKMIFDVGNDIRVCTDVISVLWVQLYYTYSKNIVEGWILRAAKQKIDIRKFRLTLLFNKFKFSLGGMTWRCRMR